MSNLLFLTAKQVADRWAAVGITGSGGNPISVKTLACWRSNGEGPQEAVIRIMGKVRYRLEDLKKYEENNFGQVCDSPESKTLRSLTPTEILEAQGFSGDAALRKTAA